MAKEKSDYEKLAKANAALKSEIAERTKAEAALRESEANLRATLNSIGDAVIATDTEGQITRMNPVAEQLTGWKFAQAQGKVLTEVFNIVHARTKEPAVELVGKVLESGKIAGLGNHTLLIAKDGSEYQIADSAAPIQDAEGAITGVVLVFRDVTGEYRVREELQESEERFQQISEASEDVFIISDTKSWDVLYVNSAFEKIWGRTVQELYDDVGVWDENIHPDDLPDNRRAWAQMVEKQSGYDVEYQVIRPDGSMRWVRDRSYPILDENGQIYRVVALVQDITEQLQAEEDLRESEARFKQIAEAIDDVFVLSDLKSWDVLYASPAFEKIWGRSVQELYDDIRTYSDGYLPADRLRIQESWAQMVAQGGRYDEEYQVKRPDGSMRWVRSQQYPVCDENGQVYRFAGIIQDITQRKRAEQALRESEANLNATLNSIGDAVIATDTGGQITRMNPVAEQLTGWKFAEAQGKVLTEVFNIVNVRTKEPAVDPVGKVLESGKVVGLGNHTLLIAKDGSEYQIADSAAPIQDAESAITGVVLVFRDVTEEYRVREELRESEARFKQIAEASEDVFVISDAKSWDVLYANPAYEQIWGRSVQDLYEDVGVWDEGIPPDDLLRIRESWARMKEEGERYDEEYRVARPDGTMRWVRSRMFPVHDESGQVYRAATLVQDITERVQQEQALQESEARFKQLADGVEDVVFVISDVKSASILYASPAYENIWGRSVQEIYEDYKDWDAGIHPDDRQRIQEKWARMVEQGDRFEEEYRVIRPDGSVRWVRDRTYPIRDKNGQIYRTVGIAQDITARVQAEQDARQQALESSILFSVSQMLAQASPDSNEIALIMAHKFVDVIGLPEVSIALYDPRDDTLRYLVDYYHPKDVAPDDENWAGKVIPLSDYPDIVRVKETLEPQIAQASDPNVDSIMLAYMKENEVKTMAYFPMAVKGRFIGIIELETWFEEYHYTPRELDLAMALTNQAAVALESAQRYETAQREISERKQAEKELRHLRNYLANIIDSMPSALIGVDMDGKVTQWNSAAQRASGLLPEEALGQPLEEAIPRLSAELERIRQAMQTRKVQINPRKTHMENGQIHYEDVTVYPLISNGVEGAIIRVDDVTERVRMQEMMIQSEKMLSVGGLAAGMAHEINNPLAGMLQTADNMSNRLTDMELPANLRAAEQAGVSMDAIRTFMESRGILRMITTINESGRRLAGIVDNMLSFARRGDASVSALDVAELLDKTLELASTDYDLKKKYDFKMINIVKEYEDNLPFAPCEKSKIQQVFLNILRNGAQAMQEVGTDKPVFVLRTRYEKARGMVRIEIEDNGPGMDEATCKRVFEPFFTTKPVGEGTGLGLSVSYFIITENHGGEMSVESTLGEGANFIIQLPIERTRSEP